MVRNLDKRIELMVPVLDREVFEEVKEALLLYFKDNTHCHRLLKDGSWKALKPEAGAEAVSVQAELQRKYSLREEARKSQPKVEFEVRRKN